MKKIFTIVASILIAISFAKSLLADGHQIYGPYPITLKGYDGDKTNSFSGIRSVQLFCAGLLKFVFTILLFGALWSVTNIKSEPLLSST